MRKITKPFKKVFPSTKRKEKVGLPPGTLKYIGDKPKEKTKIKMTQFNEDTYNIEEIKDFQIDLGKTRDSFIKWIDISGLAEVNVIEQIGNQFNFHPLVLEDILSPNQRPKMEDYGDYIFIVLRNIFWNQNLDEFGHEQISLILGNNYVISFQEKESEIFNPIYERIKVPKGKVRVMRADYLLYALLDVIIDNYFIVIEKLGENIEDIEDNLIKNPNPETLQQIYHLKRSTIDLRKSIWPMRELLNKLQREQSKLISDNLQVYLRDIYDHIFRITDLIENYRDIIFGMLDMYLSSVSNRMNDIMKVLTIISTTFIPLSFLAGFYGMNFKYMPELSQSFGYPILILVMVIIAILMLYYFKRKRWI